MFSAWLKFSAAILALSFGQENADRLIPCTTEYSVNETSSFVLKSWFIVDGDLDDIYTVSLSSSKGTHVERFLLEARDLDDKSKLLGGFFSSVPNTTRGSCGPHVNNTLTNVYETKMKKLVVTWNPPDGFVGRVIFRASVSEGTDGVITSMESVPKILKTRKGPQAENLTSLPSSILPESMEEAAKDCVSTRACFGLPENCQYKQGSCEVLVSFSPEPDGLNFRLTGLTGRKVSWIAVGLSDDRKMGDDSVTDCILLDSGKIRVQQSWNYHHPKGNKVLPQPHEGISGTSGKVVNGTLSCTWKRKLDTRIHGKDFDLVRERWHLLLARGPLKHGEKGKHHGAVASHNAFNLTSTTEDHFESSGQTTTFELHRIMLERQSVLNRYRRYISVLRIQIERTKEQMSTAIEMLADLQETEQVDSDSHYSIHSRTNTKKIKPRKGVTQRLETEI